MIVLSIKNIAVLDQCAYLPHYDQCQILPSTNEVCVGSVYSNVCRCVYNAVTVTCENFDRPIKFIFATIVFGMQVHLWTI